MTGQQRRLYQAALRTGRAFSTGGRTWVPVVPSGNGATLTVGAAVALMVLENNLVRPLIALAGPAIFSSPWWGIGMDVLAPETVVVSSSDGRAFVVTGKANDSQGFRLTPMAIAVNPIGSAPHFQVIQRGISIGIRQGF